MIVESDLLTVSGKKKTGSLVDRLKWFFGHQGEVKKNMRKGGEDHNGKKGVRPWFRSTTDERRGERGGIFY